MSKIGDYCASQCGNPRGIIGKIMTWGMNRANKVMYQEIVKNMKLSNDTKILDVGFGNGYLEKLICKKEKCTIYGIDISEDMVSVAAENNKKNIVAGNVHFSVGDCCEMDFEDNSFDIVATINTIYFWNDTMQGLREIYRVLNDNGVFYNAVLTKESLDKIFYTKSGFRKFEQDEYAEMGKQIGFKNVSYKNLGRDYGLLIIYEK